MFSRDDALLHQKLCGPGFSEDARIRISMVTAVKIPTGTKGLFDGCKTFYENDPMYAPVIRTLDQGC